MFDLLFNALGFIISVLAGCAQQFLDWGDAVSGYVGIGEVISSQCYSVSILFSNLAQLVNDVYVFVIDLESFYESVIDGTLVQDIIDWGVTLLTDLYTTPNTWLQTAINTFWRPLGMALFDGFNDYGHTFWDNMTLVLTFFTDPALSIPVFLDLYDHEWFRLFMDPLGWLFDRLGELDLDFGGLPDDILGWLWQWLLSTTEDKFKEISAGFMSLAAKMLRYLLEGVFAE